MNSIFLTSDSTISTLSDYRPHLKCPILADQSLEYDSQLLDCYYVKQTKIQLMDILFGTPVQLAQDAYIQSANHMASTQ